MSIAFKQRLMPQHRSWGEVADLLLSLIHVRPITLLCKRCKGEQVCFDQSLTIHCSCGAVTRYKSFALFHAWSSLTWMLIATEHKRNCVGATNPFRGQMLVHAEILSAIPVRPKDPIDTRVQLWRNRGAS